FEENHRQPHSDVKFVSRGNGYSLFLTPTEAVLALRDTSAVAENPQSTVLRMKFVGTRSDTYVAGLEELPGKAHYFIGNDPAQWRANAPTYAKVRYRELYSGIDLVYYGNQ